MPANTRAKQTGPFPPRAVPLSHHPLLASGTLLLEVSAPHPRPEKPSGAWAGEKRVVGFPPWLSLQGHLEQIV